MPRTSLNLSLDETTIERARRYSERHGTSISRLVDDFLSRLPAEIEEDYELTPTVRRLIGVAAGPADRETYRLYLREKYGP